MTTSLAVANEALIRIGAEPVASLSEQTAQAVAVSAVYDSTVRQLMADHYWNFALREKPLAQLSMSSTARRIVSGTYVYQLPADVLRVIGPRVYDAFELSGDQLYTDANKVDLLYIAHVDESTWPPWFVSLVAYALANAVVISVTDSAERAGVMRSDYLRALARARSVDSQQTPPAVFDLMKILTAHRNNPLAGTVV